MRQTVRPGGCDAGSGKCVLTRGLARFERPVLRWLQAKRAGYRLVGSLGELPQLCDREGLTVDAVFSTFSSLKIAISGKETEWRVC